MSILDELVGEIDKIFDDLSDVLDIGRDEIESLCQTGYLQYSSGRYEESYRTFMKVLSADRGNAKSWNGRGLALIALGKPREAKDSFTRATETDGEYPEPFVNLGDLIINSQSETPKNNLRTLEAIHFYNMALQIDPLFIPALDHKGHALLTLGRSDEAFHCFDIALESDNSYKYPWSDKGLYYGNKGEYKRAIECYELELKSNPVDSKVLVLKGLTLLELDKKDEAEKNFKKALRYNPNSVDALNALGELYRRSKDYEKALKLYGKALFLDPEHKAVKKNSAQAYIQMGNLLFYNKKQYIEAEKCFLAATERDQSQADAWCGLGYSMLRLGKYKDAIHAFSYTLAIQPDIISVWYDLGVCFEKTGELNRAANCYKKAIKEDPSNEDAWVRLGSMMMNSGRYNEAVSCYKGMIKRNKGDSFAWYNLGKAYLKLGRADEARNCFKKAEEHIGS